MPRDGERLDWGKEEHSNGEWRQGNLESHDGDERQRRWRDELEEERRREREQERWREEQRIEEMIAEVRALCSSCSTKPNLSENKPSVLRC